ncbi:DSD1 family PLP-dependent enzyme [soil metagenome]
MTRDGGLTGSGIHGAGIPADALASLQTPCLVVDLAAVDRNIARAEAIAASGGIRLRPHFKAHKCSRLMARQLASGSAIGATCQTIPEASILARAGVADLLVANQLVTDQDLATVAEVAALATLTVAVDDLEHVRLLERAVPKSPSRLGVVIEVDVGLGRCGLAPDRPELLPLADAIAATAGLDLVGVLAYEGHLSLKEDPTFRESEMLTVRDRIRHAVGRLEAAGHPVKLVTGGGTGTLSSVASLGSHTEAQPGSYVLMDATYAKLGLGFEPALFCLASVISRVVPDRAVLDAGLKAMSAEYGMPRAATPGLQVTRLADEHAVATLAEGTTLPIAARVLLQPAHVDPTVNLHSSLHVWDGSAWERWAVDGRTY